MNEVIRFALLGLGCRLAVRVRIAGPDRDLPGHGGAELLARRHRHRRRLHAVGAPERARLAVLGLGDRRCALVGLPRGAHALGDHAPACDAPAAGSCDRDARRADHAPGRRGDPLRHRSRVRSPAGCRPTGSRSGATSPSPPTASSCSRSAARRRSLCGCCTAPASSASPPKPCPRASVPRPRSACRRIAIALLNWALGSAIAGVAGILVVPIITLQVTAMTALILAAIGRRVGRRLPILPDRHGRRVRDRHRPGTGRPVRQPGGPGLVACRSS